MHNATVTKYTTNNAIPILNAQTGTAPISSFFSLAKYFSGGMIGAVGTCVHPGQNSSFLEELL